MLEMRNGFVVTDNDCMQCRKDLGERKFLFIQEIWMDGDNEYCVVANTEDLKEMSFNDIELAICGFYDSIKAMEESYKLPLGQLDELVAECSFIHIVIGNIKVKLLRGKERKKLFKSLLIRMEKCFWKRIIKDIEG